MVSKSISSMISNLTSKAKNPFFGTLTLAVLYHYWELIFALFYFDSSYSLYCKIEFVKAYFIKLAFWSEVGILLGHASIIFTLSYLIMFLSRTFVTLYKEHAIKFMYKNLDNKQIKSIDEYNLLENRIKDLDVLIDSSSTTRIGLERDLDNVKSENSKLLETIRKKEGIIESKNTELSNLNIENDKTFKTQKTNINKLNLNISSLNKNIDTLEVELKESKKKIKELTNYDEVDLEDTYSIYDKLNETNKLKTALKILESEGLVGAFISFYGNMQGDLIYKGKILGIETFSKLKLYNFLQREKDGSILNLYRPTELGTKVYKSIAE